MKVPKHIKQKPLKPSILAFTSAAPHVTTKLKRAKKTVSDVGGDTIVDLLEKAGQKVIFKKIIADDETMIQDAVMYVLGLNEVDVAIFSGGTGITPTDITIETVLPFLRKSCRGLASFSAE